MTKAKTDGFRWLPSYYEAVRDLPDSERLTIYDAIIDFGFGYEEPDLPPLLSGYFRLIKPSLERSIRFETKQKENGSKGGRPPKPKGNPEETQNDSGENLAIAVAVANDVAVADECSPPPTSKTKYGEFGWVRLTEDQYQKLKDDLGQSELDRCIQYVDESAESTGNKNKWKNWCVVIRKCHRDGWGKKPEQRTTVDLSWRNQA